jgi:hypothetical protein
MNNITNQTKRERNITMKTKTFLILLCLALGGAGLRAAPLGPAISYQGLLHDNGAPANGAYEMQFRLFDALTGGAQRGATHSANNVPVTNGLFSLTLPYGASEFDGTALFLQVSVRPFGSSGAYSNLVPRQAILPAPEAVHAAKADVANSVPSGAITGAQLASGAVAGTHIASGQVVKSLNGLKDAVSLMAGANVTLTPSGNSLQISANPSLASDHLTAPDGSPANAVQVANNGNVQILGNLTLEVGRNPELYTGTGSSDLGRYLFLLNSASLRTASGLKAGGVLVADNYSYANPGINDLIVRGSVGIGTPTPRTALDVNGEITWGGSALNTDQGGSIELGDALSSGKRPFIDFHYGVGASEDYNVRLINDGNKQLSLRGNLRLSDGGQYIFCDDRLHIQASERLYLNPHPGGGPVYVGGGSGGFQQDLVVTGTTTTKVLTITGGSDLSENFDIAAAEGAPEPGMVVCIDAANPGKLVRSSKAHDRTVAGIISGANGISTGMMMGQAGSVADGKHPVALTGRVYAWADASTGAIQPGDLLTTSDTPGHAMRVSDHAAAQGAVLGKAMTALPEGKGLVLVLVSLQ